MPRNPTSTPSTAMAGPGPTHPDNAEGSGPATPPDAPPVCPACDVPMVLKSGLGIPAIQATRTLRKKGHDVFDQLWTGPRACMHRKEAYAWLAEELGIEVEDAHFGQFDAEQCRRAIAAVDGFWEKHLRAEEPLGTIADLLKGAGK